MQLLRRFGRRSLVGVGVAGDERQALLAGREAKAPKHEPDPVLGDPDPAPLGPGELAGDPPRPEPGVAEREGEDPVLEVGPRLVWHPRRPTLANPQAVEAIALELRLPGVIGRARHAHLTAGLGDVAELLGQREQPQAVAEQHVIMRHRMRSFLSLIGVELGSLSASADAPAMAGASDFTVFSLISVVAGDVGVRSA